METWIAERMMRLATSNLPTEREVWGRAMRSEFESLQTGRLAWAMGCLLATLNWRLRKDWVFLAVAAATILLIDPVMFLPIKLAPRWFGPDAFRLYFLAYPAGACLALAVWRPRYAFAAAVAMTLTRLAMAELTFAVLMRQRFPADFNVMNAPFVVGASAILGWCLLGAAVGRRFAVRPKTIGG